MPRTAAQPPARAVTSEASLPVPDASRRGARTVALMAAAGAAGATTWSLGRHGYLVVVEYLGWVSAGATVDALRVGDLLALVAVVVATGVSAWFTLGLAVAVGCAAARATGGAWLAGERVVARRAPALVRRVLVVSTGTGLALAGAAGAATAVAPPTPEHLGWTVTSPAWPGAGPDTAPSSTRDAPATDAGGEPAGDAAGPGIAPTADEAPAADGAAAANGAPPPGPSGPEPGAVPAGTATTVPTVAASPAGGADVTVRPGDTLWAIARAHLPAGATTADIAAAWPAWHTANAAIVGPDPDHIVPGQRLVTPAPGSPAPAPAPAATEAADR